MDNVSLAVLDKICSLAAFGRYVIFSEDEIFEAFPDGVPRDLGELKRTLKNLVNEGYIDLKYSGGDLYCIAPLKKYEPVYEPVCEPEPEEEEEKPEVKRGSPFFAAFAGGALGSLIISLIFAILSYA